MAPRPPARRSTRRKQIIGARVNGLGVSGSEVVIDGDNLVITVPGNDGNEARNLGQTARLYIRPVIHVIPAAGPGPAAAGRAGQRRVRHRAPGQPGAPPGAPPGVRRVRRRTALRQPGAPGQPGASQAPLPARRPGAAAAAVPAGTDPPTPAPGPARAGAHRRARSTAAAGPTGRRRTRRPWRLASPTRSSCGRAPTSRSRSWRCSSRPTRCNDEDVLAGNDDPNLPLVTCSTGPQERCYLLDKSIISGEQIESADSGFDQQRGEYVVTCSSRTTRRDIWADFTAANVGTQTAFVLDSQVVSAPAIQEAIPGGRTQITGQFTADSARELANVLKYGSLPLSFESSEAETVSATLGLTSLRAGLIAGAIGLALVLLYSLLYYRVLGLLTALSLVASGAMVYAILVLLGRYIDYTLDLAGIAGLIIGIGTTADSFVVFFERIKDEIREGRSFRSAVPRGWARARKTILSGNAVSFLAAAVLYFLAVGQVKGFAFTLGLTTILDVVVVFLVTWPLVYLASKSPTLAKPAFNGLGAVQQIARERRAVHATGRG